MCSKHGVKILLSQCDFVTRYRDFRECVLVGSCKFILFLFSNHVFGQIMAAPVLKVEQQRAIKFCYCLGKPATKVYTLIKQVYGDEALAQATVFRWHSEFTSGRESTQLILHSGHPMNSRIEINKNTIAALMAEDLQITIKELNSVKDLAYSSVQKILHDGFNLR